MKSLALVLILAAICQAINQHVNNGLDQGVMEAATSQPMRDELGACP